MGNSIVEFVSSLLPGAKIDNEQAAKTFVCPLDKQSFRQLDKNYGTGDSGDFLAIGLKADEDFGTLTGEEPIGGNIGIFLNRGAVGHDKGQEPERNVSYAVLHELTEFGIVSPTPRVQDIAQKISDSVIGGDFSPSTKSRFGVGHLSALGMEYEAALNSSGNQRQALLEAGRLHRTTNKAIRERVGGPAPDIWARHSILKRLCEAERKK